MLMQFLITFPSLLRHPWHATTLDTEIYWTHCAPITSQGRSYLHPWGFGLFVHFLVSPPSASPISFSPPWPGVPVMLLSCSWRVFIGVSSSILGMAGAACGVWGWVGFMGCCTTGLLYCSRGQGTSKHRETQCPHDVVILAQGQTNPHNGGATLKARRPHCRVRHSRAGNKCPLHIYSLRGLAYLHNKALLKKKKKNTHPGLNLNVYMFIIKTKIERGHAPLHVRLKKIKGQWHQYFEMFWDWVMRRPLMKDEPGIYLPNSP